MAGRALQPDWCCTAKRLRSKHGKPDGLPHTGCLWLFGRRRQAQLISRSARRILPKHPLRGQHRPQNDTWIAAVAIAYGLPLATFNFKDYADIEANHGLSLIRPRPGEAW